MSRPDTVLILGARGRLGFAAAQAFSVAGWRVLAQVRPGTTGPMLPGVQWLAARPDDTDTLAAAAKGAGVVVQALNPVYTHRAWRRELPELTQAAIDVTRALAPAPSDDLPLLVLPGTVYNFGTAMPPLLREDTAQAADTVKGRMRVAVEEQIQAATRDGRMKAVVVRSGDFFGSGTGSWLDGVMVKDIQRGKLTIPGRMDVATPWAYLPDLARSYVDIAGQRQRIGVFETFHFAGHHLSGQDWADAMTDIATEQGWLKLREGLRTRTLPWPLVRAMGLVMPQMAALADMRYLWRTPHALVNTHMTGRIGPEPHTPFPQALRAALEALRLLQPRASTTPRAPSLTRSAS